jgi:leader peptidase (prepilin peptidase)/N-methyltransferase
MIAGLTIALCAGAIGACLGSYAATAALRLTGSEQSLWGRSHCDACGVELGFVSTLPIISFVQRQGTCAICGARIDVAHLVGELSGVVIVLSALAIAPFGRAVMLAGLGLALLASSIVDMRSQRLPDGLTLAAGGIGATLAAQRSIESLLIGCATAAGAFALLELVRRGYQRFRSEPGLGFGDVKLVSALAIWLGLAIPWALVLAAVGGLVGMVIFRPRRRRLAFGPYIAASAWIVGLFGEASGWLT